MSPNADSMAESDASLRAGFVKGLVICVCLMLALVGVIVIANHGHHRPEGVAERWLSAVSDTTRKGVRADARDRVEKIGPLALAAGLMPPAGSTDGKASFDDLEVGRAVRMAGSPQVRVPFQLHEYAKSGPEPKKIGRVVLEPADADAGWRVVGLEEGPGPAEKRVLGHG